MLLHREKHICRSTYRIIQAGNAFAIEEQRENRTARTPAQYQTADEAIEALKYFDREYIILKEE